MTVPNFIQRVDKRGLGVPPPPIKIHSVIHLCGGNTKRRAKRKQHQVGVGVKGRPKGRELWGIPTCFPNVNLSLKIAYVNEGRNLHWNKKALFRISIYKAICKKPVTSTAAFILVMLKEEEEPKRVTALRLLCVSEMY